MSSIPSRGTSWKPSVGGRMERIRLERSFHVATLDWDAPLIEKQVVGFVEAALTGPGCPIS